MTTFTPIKEPSIESSKEKTFRIATNDFGDGYRQRVGDGINRSSEIWQLTWNVLSQTQADDITDFFDQQEGITPFEWVTPDGNTKSFFVLEYSVILLPNGQFSISAKLEEDLNQ